MYKNQDHIMQPKFSVIIPMYNVEELYLKQCIDSIFQQSYKNWQCILIDNGSKKNYSHILHNYQQDPRFQLYRIEQNVGIFSARQYGVEKSSGTHISFCDSDDWLHKDYFSQIVKNLDPNCDLYLTKTISAFESGYKEEGIWANKGLKEYKAKEMFNALCNRKMSSWALWGKIFSRDLLLKIYKEINNQSSLVMTEDCLLVLIYSYYAKHVLYIPKKSYYYRIHSQSTGRKKTTVTKLEQYLDNINTTLSYLKFFLTEHNEPLNCLEPLRQECLDMFLQECIEIKNIDQYFDQILDTFGPSTICTHIVQKTMFKTQNLYSLCHKSIQKTFSSDSLFYQIFRFFALKAYRMFHT